MRLALIAVLALTATPALAVTTPCLDMRDVRGFDYRDARTTVARTSDGRSYEVKFMGRCGHSRIHPQLAFNQLNGFCLSRGNLLDSYDGGACVIRQISELEPSH